MSSIIKEAGLSGDERTCDRERYFLNQLIVETLITKFISDLLTHFLIIKEELCQDVILVS